MNALEYVSKQSKDDGRMNMLKLLFTKNTLLTDIVPILKEFFVPFDALVYMMSFHSDRDPSVQWILAIMECSYGSEYRLKALKYLLEMSKGVITKDEWDDIFKLFSTDEYRTAVVKLILSQKTEPEEEPEACPEASQVYDSDEDVPEINQLSISNQTTNQISSSQSMSNAVNIECGDNATFEGAINISCIGKQTIPNTTVTTYNGAITCGDMINTCVGSQITYVQSCE